MSLTRAAFRALGDGFSCRLQKSQMIRAFSTNWTPDDGSNKNESDSASQSNDDFIRNLLGGGDDDRTNSFLRKLDKAGTARGRSEGNSFRGLDGLNWGSSTLNDGMERELEKAANYFEFDPDETAREDYNYRPDMNFRPGMTYKTKDLDLTKAGVWKPGKRDEFKVTTDEVLKKADFRNVRFLANFLTEAGIMIKRSETGISAKAQRKVAREIKTARAFGLLPFTTMGTKAFEVGRTMEDQDEDFEEFDYDAPTVRPASYRGPL